LTSPDDGAVLTETTVELSWQPPTTWNDCDGTHEYTVYIEQDDTPGDGLPIDSSTRVDDCSGITDTTCTVELEAGHAYDWLVVASNESNSTPSFSSDFRIQGAVSGRVYLGVVAWLPGCLGAGRVQVVGIGYWVLGTWLLGRLAPPCPYKSCKSVQIGVTRWIYLRPSLPICVHLRSSHPCFQKPPLPPTRNS
jgi:hypothetical protein